jgi:hypothetical protein
MQNFKLTIFGLKLNFEHLRSHLRCKNIDKKRFEAVEDMFKTPYEEEFQSH